MPLGHNTTPNQRLPARFYSCHWNIAQHQIKDSQLDLTRAVAVPAPPEVCTYILSKQRMWSFPGTWSDQDAWESLIGCCAVPCLNGSVMPHLDRESLRESKWYGAFQSSDLNNQGLEERLQLKIGGMSMILFIILYEMSLQCIILISCLS